jgi:hypothetical protein
MRFWKVALWAVGITTATELLQAELPQINQIGREEIVSWWYMERPSVATDSKGQPHFVCDVGGPTSRTLLKFHRVNGEWSGGPFATGVPGGRYDAGRLYISQMEIDSKDRAWISCKLGIKEFGSMYGQGLWLFSNVANRPMPPEQFFRFVVVYKGMGVVTTDAKYPDEGVVMGTFGNWEKVSDTGQTLGRGSINAGHGGEKVRARIASYAPKYRAASDTRTYPDGIWHTAMCGSSKFTASYQNSARYKAGEGPIPWAAYNAYSIMGVDYTHPGVGIDATDQRICYISSVFYGKICINIWDGTRMLFNPASLKVLDDKVSFEERHAPAITPALGAQGGAFFFWTTTDDRINCAYVSKKGVVGPVQDITAGTFAGAATDRFGNLHLVYNGKYGICYRKLLVYTLMPIEPKGTVSSTRIPRFRWTDTKAKSYTLEVSKDGRKMPLVTVTDQTWNPPSELHVGSYSWRVKEGGPSSLNKWSPAHDFAIPPVKPDPIGPEKRFAAAVTPTFEWSNFDPAANRYTIELFKNGDSLGTLNATGDVKGELVRTADWANRLGAGLYAWRIKATRQLSGYPVSSAWTPKTDFQVRVPAPAAMLLPGVNDTFNPGSGTVGCNWSEASGASDYKLRILYNGNLLDTHYGISDTNYPLKRYFHPGYHSLMVQPKNDAGNGAWSAPVTFLVRRLMKPANENSLDQAPYKHTWTRSKDASRYLAKLARYNPATQAYEMLREKWLAQSDPGEDPVWKPNYAFPAGAYRWVVTDYFGSKQGYTSVAYFQVGVPGRPELLSPLGEVASRRGIPFSWTDPSDTVKDFQIQVWKGNTKVKDTGWLSKWDLDNAGGFTRKFSFTDDAIGSFTWKVRGRNKAGAGPWRSATFTLAPLPATGGAPL